MGEGICYPFRVQGRALLYLLLAKYINALLKPGVFMLCKELRSGFSGLCPTPRKGTWSL